MEDHDQDKFQLDSNFGRDYEYESGLPTVGVEGRLFSCKSFWLSKLCCPLFVKSIITYGYALPLKSFPDSAFFKNNNSALQHAEFVEAAIEKLLVNRCISESSSPPHVVNPLTVAAGKKMRLVLDLRYVNQFVECPTFKYEDLRTLSEIFEAGFFFFTFDLESGYHHVGIVPHHHQLLGFSWLFANGSRRYFLFKVLPFGLSSACYVFTKLLRPLVTRWRSMGHVSFIYIDDGISGAPDLITAKAASFIERKDLALSGLKENEKKSVWEPMQIGQWLGIIIDTIKMNFQVPSKKIDKLKHAITNALSSPFVVIKDLARIAGYLVSMTIALGPIARLFTRQMYIAIARRNSWRDSVLVSEPIAQELKFWLQHVDAFNGYAIHRKFSATAIVYSDASDTGFGGFSTLIGNHVSTGHWNHCDAAQSSTFRELKAILMVLQSFSKTLEHRKVKWFSDSENSCRIVAVGSPKPHLQSIAVSIFELCMSYDIELEVQWLPRSQNERADHISRIVDRDDWSLNPELFKLLDSRWGPHTVDRFASFYNAQLGRFNSRFWQPNTEAVDAFTQDWSVDNNWLCPPVALVVRTVKHLISCKGAGTLIIPEWPSSFFWPFVNPTTGTVKKFVKDWYVLPTTNPVFVAGRGHNLNPSYKSAFAAYPTFRVLALRLVCCE